MILRPLPAVAASSAVNSAWVAVEETQHRLARQYWLVTQPDHAALAGAIAAALGPPLLPELPPDILQAVAVHDDGWSAIDARVPCSGGRPLSFLDAGPAMFLEAWRKSIARGEQAGAMAGAIVSRHFWRIGKMRSETGKDSGADQRAVLDFLAQEEARQRDLVGSAPWRQFEFLTDVLQFCDLLSLYLCCGSEEDVSFPQRFGGESFALRRIRQPENSAAVCRLEPSPFRHGSDFAVMARGFPVEPPRTAQLAFLLW